jgi:cell division protein FtsQ
LVALPAEALAKAGVVEKLIFFMSDWKRNMKRVFAISAWCALGISAVLLLIAAIQKKNQQVCKGYEIEITGVEEQLFFDKRKIEDLIFGNQLPLNKPISSINLREMENKLETNVWVKDAQLFFDNTEKLQIRVYEREPIARVFTSAGKSFYIDSSGRRLPLPENQTAHLLVFTNFPAEKGKLKRGDSILMRQMAELSAFINKNEFWKAQIQQIEITPIKTFELVPLVGKHVVVFGNGEDMQEKFNRLQVFYKEVMSKTGFDCYQKLDVQYKDQVVATRKGAALSRQDSLLAVQKVKQLIAEGQQIKPDTLMQGKVQPIEKLEVSEQTLTSYDLLPMKTDTGLAETPKNPDSVKTIFEKSSSQNISKKPVKKDDKKKDANKPKAVMEKRGF